VKSPHSLISKHIWRVSKRELNLHIKISPALFDSGVEATIWPTSLDYQKRAGLTLSRTWQDCLRMRSSKIALRLLSGKGKEIRPLPSPSTTTRVLSHYYVPPRTSPMWRSP